MPNVLTEPDRLGDLIKLEEDQHYSRDEVTVELGQTLTPGMVVAMHGSTMQVIQINPGASDGQGDAYGIAIEEVDATTEEKKTVIIARHSLVAEDALIWPANIPANKLRKGLEDLRALGIILRKDA